MTYREIAPAPALREWVECFWTRQDDGDPGPHRVLPDGCADLVFDLTRGDAQAVGTMTKPVVVTGGGDFLGVRFHPGRAAAFLRIPLAEITDAQVPFRFDGEPSIGELERELLRRLANAPSRDQRVDVAIERIVRSGGTARIDDVASDANLSRQHLARQFAQHVGVSPKTFARVIRFRRVVDATWKREDVDWADVAARFGYYDQSHLIHEFRELGGATPFQISNPPQADAR